MRALFENIEGGAAVEEKWPGELDMGATRAWAMPLEQNGHAADAAEFIRWRWRNALSLTAAAEALGTSVVSQCGVLELAGLFGGPCAARTRDQQIKSLG